MTPRRVRSERTGKLGWQYRVTNNGRRRKVTFWVVERRDAEKALGAWFSEQEKAALGLPDAAGWKMPWRELVERFLAEYAFSTERRKKVVARMLGRNDLALQVGADLAHVGQLNTRALKVRADRGAHYAIFSVQAPLKHGGPPRPA